MLLWALVVAIPLAIINLVVDRQLTKSSSSPACRS